MMPLVGCDSPASNQPAQERPLTDEEQVIKKVEEFTAANYPIDEILKWTRDEQSRSNPWFQSPRHWPDAWQAIDAMFTAAHAAYSDPEEHMKLYLAQATLMATVDLPASDVMLSALAAKPDWELYHQVNVSSSYRDIYADALIPLCNTLQPMTGELEWRQYEGFLETCISWAGDDPKLLWKGAAEEYAKLEAARERVSDFHEEISVLFPAGGVCNHGDCGSYGWMSQDDEGQVITKCIGEDCMFKGWESNTPDGIANTRCQDGNCLEKGWKTTTAKKATWVATCNDGNCETGGWVMKNKKRRYKVTCKQGKEGGMCFFDGYDVVAPDGWKLSCECDGDCFKVGVWCTPQP